MEFIFVKIFNIFIKNQKYFLDKIYIMSSIRDEAPKGRRDSDIEFYLKSGLTDEQVRDILKATKKDPKEVDTIMTNYMEAKHKMIKLVKKFVRKIEKHYGTMEIPNLIQKGIHFAKKYKFTDSEVESFIRFVLNKDISKFYYYDQEMEKTAMSKFLGIAPTDVATKPFEVKPMDTAALNEILRLYESTKQLYATVKDQRLLYNGSVEITTGFDVNKHNSAIYIHPVVVGLFLPRIGILEQRTLFSNFGRLVSMHTMPYQAKINPYHTEITYPQEIKNDYELAIEIARDPNSLTYFSEETPIVNMLKRFKVQIELWRNVLNMQQGKFNSTKDTLDADDGISGFIRALNSFDWTYFDGGNNNNMMDEATVLRKFLSVFAIRPTFVQLSSVPIDPNTGTASMKVEQFLGLGRNITSVTDISYVNIQVVNLKIPNPNTDKIAKNCDKATLQEIIETDTPELYIEHRTFVPKSRKVLLTRHLMFVHINRRSRSRMGEPELNIDYLTRIPSYYLSETKINSNMLLTDAEVTQAKKVTPKNAYVYYEYDSTLYEKEVKSTVAARGGALPLIDWRTTAGGGAGELDLTENAVGSYEGMYGIGVSLIDLKEKKLYLKSVIGIEKVSENIKSPQCISIVSMYDVTQENITTHYPEKLPFSQYVAYIPQLGEKEGVQLFKKIDDLKIRGEGNVYVDTHNLNESVYDYIKSYGTIFVYADKEGFNMDVTPSQKGGADLVGGLNVELKINKIPTAGDAIDKKIVNTAVSAFLTEFKNNLTGVVGAAAAANDPDATARGVYWGVTDPNVASVSIGNAKAIGNKLVKTIQDELQRINVIIDPHIPLIQ